MSGENLKYDIYLVGYPGDVGGASTECWHLLNLFRLARLRVAAIPTWEASPRWKSLLDSIGIDTIETKPDKIPDVPGLPGSTVVSLCNSKFLAHYGVFKNIGCKIAWLNCMTYAFIAEKGMFEVYGPPDVMVCQSEYQKEMLSPILKPHGVAPESYRVIRGAFDLEGWEYNPTPHKPREAFVVGRVARDDPAKWSSNTWKIYGQICYAKKKALMLGMSKRTRDKLGKSPSWAEIHKPNGIPVREFYSRLHCLLPVNGGARENWPRAGLEARAGGVPVVAQNLWGWKEMIQHGVTGFLGNTDDELAHYAGMLAHDEELRISIAQAARRRIESELANPDRLKSEWLDVINGLKGKAVAA